MRQKFGASTRTQVFAKFLRIEVAPGNSTQRFDHLFATWEEGVWVANPHNGTLYANRRISEMFGYEDAEFRQLTVEEVFATAGAPALAEFVREDRTSAASSDAAIQTRDGERIWIQLTAMPWRDERGDKKSVVLRIQNITLQKRVEHALKSCEQVLDGLMELSADCICRFDGDLNCTYVNPAFMQAMRCTKDDVLGEKLENLNSYFAPSADWMAALRRVLQTGERQRVQQRHPLFGGAEAFLLPEPSADFLPLSIIAVVRKPRA
jgi:PAS domain S-box-containing protein